jgi:pimeloyl-ACP methyl ester carboxylesterase
MNSAPTPLPRPRSYARTVPWFTLPPTPTLPQAARSGLATINGTSIFFAQFGAGPPVLLLHGGMANSNYWGSQIRELARTFSVIVMDTRGHGRSPLTSRSLSYALFAQDVIELLNFLEIPQVSLVGWSDGAITGLELVTKRPDRVAKLFAFGANSSVKGLRANGAKSPIFVMFGQRCKAEYALLSPQPEKWPQLLNGLRLMWRSEPNFTTQSLMGVRVPTLISLGEYDEIIRPDDNERLADAIPGARLVIQQAVSHFAMLQNPEQFNNAVVEFLTTKQ